MVSMGQRTERMVKFLLSGGSAALVEYMSFAAMLYIGRQSVILAQVLSFGIGMIVSFTLNKYWVFRSSNSYSKEALRYLLLALINIVLGASIMGILTQVFSVASLFAKLIVMAMIACWNYFIFSRIIFSRGAH